MQNEPETIYLPLAEIHKLQAAGKLPEGKFIRISDFPGQPPYGDQPDWDEDDERIFKEMVADGVFGRTKNAARKKGRKAKNKKP